MRNTKSPAAHFNCAWTGFPGLAGMVCAGLLLAAMPARAQSPTPPPPARIIVVGEASVGAVPDRAQIRSGVTTKGKTAKEATDANAKAMTAVMAALADAGIASKDIQTARFSLDPVYAAAEPKTEPKLVGYSASNQLRITIGQVGKLGDILDRLVAAGATDVGNVVFLVSDQAKYLDEARAAAVADAKRKAALYASAAGLKLGPVAWITEDSTYAPPIAMAAMPAPAVRAAMPIAGGEETLNVRITVGFDVAP
jgi:uncharacterized protein